MSSSDQPRTDGGAWLHFVGVGGSGMSALAQYHALAAAAAGGLVTGSDRAFDLGEREEIRLRLEALGIVIMPQDGGSLCRPDGRLCDAVVTSTAVEDTILDVREARRLSIPILHRSELLALYVASHRTIAVSGTSGKSTVTAMVFTILQECGREPGLLTGGPLAALIEAGHLGNAWAPAGSPDEAWLVIEADESDGSLVRYHPEISVVLNLGLDHKPTADVLQMFTTLKNQTRGPCVVAAAENLASLRQGASLFGLAAGRPAALPGTWADQVVLEPRQSRFTIEGQAFVLPQPGQYNVLNATAAVAVGREIGLPLAQMARAMAGFRGVARRFSSVGTAGGVEVIDDFAHNPDKIAAALAAAAARLPNPAGRILAVFQPHGFGPTRFLRESLGAAFASGLRPGDILWLPEIFFTGGTVTRDISAADLAEDIIAAGREARFCADRSALPALIAAEARSGDLVLVMGARDPSLTDFCLEILEKLDRE